MTLAVRTWQRVRPLAWNLIAAGVGQGATLALTMGLSNALGPAQFGLFSIVTSTILALSALAQIGLAFTATNFVARHLATDRPLAERIAAFCVSGASTAGLILGLMLLLGSWLVATYLYGNSTLFPLFLIAGIGIPAATLSLIQNAVLIGLQQFRPLAWNAIVYAAALLSASFCGYLVGGAAGAGVGYVIAIVIRCGHGSWLLGRAFTPLPPWRRPTDARELLRELAPFALPSALAGLTMTPAVWLSNAWLVNARGLQELGLFSTAFILKTLVVFVPIQMGTAFLPRYIAATGGDPTRANRLLLQILLLIFAFSATIAGSVAALAPWLMTVFGAGFAAGATTLRWLMAAVVMESLATIASYRLAGERRMWTSLLAYTLPKDLILIASALVLASRFGASGLGVAHFLSWTYGFLAIAVVTLRPTRLSAMEGFAQR